MIVALYVKFPDVVIIELVAEYDVAVNVEVYDRFGPDITHFLIVAPNFPEHTTSHFTVELFFYIQTTS